MSDSTYGATLEERLQNPVTQWLSALHSFGRSLRVACPATIVSFDATKQTVVAQPSIQEIERVGGVMKTFTLPPLVDVPVVLPRAGGFTLTLPIAAGDECLIVFADSCIDSWWQSGSTQPPFEQRRHHLADALAIVGLWNQTRVLADYSTSSAQLRNDAGTVTIDVAAAQVTVSAPTIRLNAGTEIDLSAPTINLSATSALNIASSANNTKVDTKTFLTHTHSGVSTGGGVSGPVD